jgi:exonuclease III
MNLLTYNVQHGKKVKSIVKKLNNSPLADIYLFQEFPKSAIPLFQQKFTDFKSVYSRTRTHPIRDKDEGNLIAFRSKYKLLSKKVINYCDKYIAKSLRRVFLGESLSNHGLIVQLQVNENPNLKNSKLNVATTQLSTFCFNSLRFSQTKQTLEVLKGNEPTIFAGDFNVPNLKGQNILNQLAEEYALRDIKQFIDYNKKLFKTYEYPLKIYKTQLDQIFVKEVTISKARILSHWKFSDHKPISIDFTL